MFQTVVSQLGELPAAIDLQLQPARVIVDSTKSRDGQNVEATLTSRPSASSQPVYNYLSVPARNALFVNGETPVQSGDILKYFVLWDASELPSESTIFGNKSGSTSEEGDDADVSALIATFAREKAIELPIGQVISDNELLIQTPLIRPIELSAKIEVWRYVDDRLKNIEGRLNLYEYSAPYKIGWEPSPDEKGLEQLIERLNQWLRQSRPTVEWSPHALVETLSESYRTHPQLQPYLSAAVLSQEAFEPHDARILQEAVWLRDVSNWARGSSFDPVERAKALFDWTVRNIQLDADAGALPYRPWQILVHGHGTAAQRAWVFALLCRQQNLDVVMLSLPAAEGEPSTVRFWLPALFSGGELYLFDTRLGLPIPTADRTGVATLSSVKADDSLLRALDLEGTPYPVKSADLEGLTASVVASPFELTRRARLVEGQLSGENRLVLTLDGAFPVEQLAAQPGIREVRLWALPAQTILDQMGMEEAARSRARQEFEPFARHPRLWKARVLHFRGKKTLDDAAQAAAFSDPVDDHREAGLLYMDPNVRPTQRAIAGIIQPGPKAVQEAAKANAGYWVGLLSLDEGEYAAAENWFAMALPSPATARWQGGARYNLSRSLEGQGKLAEAARILESDQSPQRHGNLLRARWLKEREAQGDAAQASP